MTPPSSRNELDPVVVAREVLHREAQALEAVAGRLGSPFAEAVEILEKAQGRVVVSGVGKSGLVGGKIAATLTSTGTPAMFLHPTEAMHGDLGVVGKHDVILALSKSGRSPELLQLLPYLRRVGTPVIAVAESAESPLGLEATVVLETGTVEEACSLDLVPTSSSTVLMALGDALAVALLRRRGLTAEDFAFVHPGGLLGRKASRRVREVMHAGDRLPCLSETVLLRAALTEIVDKGLGVVVLADAEGRLVGILTDGDVKRILLSAAGDDVLSRPVKDFMSRNPRTIEPDALVASAVRRMEERNPGAVTSLVVLDGEAPMGVVHLHDCLSL